MSADIRLDQLLEHPAIWRGRSAARTEALPTGFGSLDECLPGRGWPRAGLVEILVDRPGCGELTLLMPALAALTQQSAPGWGRWCAFVAPPFEPFAPALAAHGVALEKLFIVRTSEPLWAFEQSLRSGACDAVLGWMQRLRTRDVRRLQLATERGRALGVAFRTRRAAREPSPAVLRLVLDPAECGARITFLKSRGGRRGSIDISWNTAELFGSR